MDNGKKEKNGQIQKHMMHFANPKVIIICAILIIIIVFNDIVNVFIDVPYWFIWTEFIVGDILTISVLLTSKFNSFLSNEDVEKFVIIFTIASVFIYVVEKMLIRFIHIINKEPFILYLIIRLALILGVMSLYLLFCKWSHRNIKVTKKEKFREISYQVGIEAEENEGNPYQIAYEKVNKFVNNDYAKLMWLKAESNLSSYDTIINVALKFSLALVTVMTFFWSVISKYSEYNNGIFVLQIVYTGVVVLSVCIIISAHNRYKYNGIGDKYVKQAIDSLEKDMIANRNVKNEFL